MQQLYSNYGIEIMLDGEDYYMKYDSGEIVSEIRQINISKKEAEDIQKQPDITSIYKYIIINLNDRIY